MKCVVLYEFEITRRINVVTELIEGAIKSSRYLNQEELYLTPNEIAQIYSGLIDVISYNKTPEYTKAGVLYVVTLLTDLLSEDISIARKDKVTSRLRSIDTELHNLAKQVMERKVEEVI